MQREINLFYSDFSSKKVDMFLLLSNKSRNPKDIESYTVVSCKSSLIIPDTITKKECIIVVFRKRNNTHEMY